jgi:hypothetical protein
MAQETGRGETKGTFFESESGEVKRKANEILSKFGERLPINPYHFNKDIDGALVGYIITPFPRVAQIEINVGEKMRRLTLNERFKYSFRKHNPNPRITREIFLTLGEDVRAIFRIKQSGKIYNRMGGLASLEEISTFSEALKFLESKLT